MGYKFNDSYFDKIDNEEKAYWLGFLAADAGINIPGIGRENGWVLCINLQKDDKDHLSKFQKSLERNGPIYETDSAVRLQIGSEKLVKSLIKLGVGPQKSHVLTPWTGPPKLQSHYWRGLFDGDGSISRTLRKKRDIEYTVWRLSFNGNLAVVSGFRDFLEEKGIERLGYFQEHGSVYKVQWGGFASVANIAKIFYQDYTISLDRKAKLFEQLLDAYESKIAYKR